jgi:hypothetical protein
MPSLFERINFARIVTVFAIIFGVALGLCGITAIFPSGRTQAFPTVALVEFGAMVLAAAGMVLTIAVWVIWTVINNFSGKGTSPQKLFDNSDDEQ